MDKTYKFIESDFTGYRRLHKRLNEVSRNILNYLIEHGYFYNSPGLNYSWFFISDDSLDMYAKYSDGDDWCFSVPLKHVYTWDETEKYLDEVIRKRQDMEWTTCTNKDGIQKTYRELSGMNELHMFLQNQLKYLINRYGEHNLKSDGKDSN